MRSNFAAGLLLITAACWETPETGAGLAHRALESAPDSALNLTFRGAARAWFEALPVGEEHSLALRFLPAHRGTYRAIVLSDPSGRFYVGLAPLAAPPERAIELRLGDSTSSFPIPARDADRGEGARWHQLVLRFSAQQVSVLLDGVELGSATSAEPWPLGEIVIGRRGVPGSVADQFFGLIDDVRILQGPELVASLDFDAAHAFEGSPARERLSLLGAARWVEVSPDHDSASDRRLVAAPSHQTRFVLPFAVGETWRVSQSIDSGRSHRDEAAFAVDFEATPEVLAPAPLVRAAAAGKVVARVDVFPDVPPGPMADPSSSRGSAAERNLVCLEHAPVEYSCYVHLRKGSVLVALGDHVQSGASIGVVGSSGTREPHLHFALSDRPEPNAPGTFADLVTRPFVFEDYWASDDQGTSWHHVEHGVPKRGQWLSRREPATNR